MFIVEMKRLKRISWLRNEKGILENERLKDSRVLKYKDNHTNCNLNFMLFVIFDNVVGINYLPLHWLLIILLFC